MCSGRVLTQSQMKKYKEVQFVKLFASNANLNGSQIARQIGTSPKVVNRLKQRIKRNGTLVPKKRGKSRNVTKEMINFLNQWFKTGTNVGKSFKYAYAELVKHFGEDNVKVTQHGCYKAFKRYSDFTFKRIQRIKVCSNTKANKEKRVQYLQRFLPYHQAESLGKCEIIFIDEAGFNLDKQGTNYA